MSGQIGRTPNKLAKITEQNYYNWKEFCGGVGDVVDGTICVSEVFDDADDNHVSTNMANINEQKML